MLRSILSIGLPALLLSAVLAAEAHGVELLFGRGDEANGPVKVISAEVTFDRDAGLVEFSGDVRVSRGDTRILSDAADAYIDAGNASKLERIVLKGNVELNSGQSTATADTGEYDLIDEVITLFGNVRIKSENLEFAAEALHYDVKTGQSRLFDNASAIVTDSN